MSHFKPQAVGAVSFGLITTATSALGLPREFWLTTLGIGVVLAVWSAAGFFYTRHETKSYVNLSFATPKPNPRVRVFQETFPGSPGGSSASFSVSGTIAARSMTGESFVPPSRTREERYASFVFARVVNDHSSPGIGVAAKDVRARVSYYSPDNVWRLDKVKGRWRNSDSPVDLSPFRTHPESEAIDIPPDGEPRELDLVMKFPEDAYCYAYNNENLNHEWSRMPEHRITELEFIAEVTVRGSNFVEISRRFVISHGGIGSIVNIREAE